MTTFDAPDFDTWRASKRPRTQADDEYLAGCLVMLSNGGASRDSFSPAAADLTKTVGGGYKCDECGKEFPSYQALGGHRTSHRIKPSSIEAKRRERKTPIEDIEGSRQSGRSHRCTICNRSFPTGQALGGHKRKHYEGVISRKGSSGGRGGENRLINSCSGGGVSSGVTSTSVDGGDAGQSCGAGAELDLNFPAPAELELNLTLSL